MKIHLFLIAILLSLGLASAINISAETNSNILIPEIESSIDLTLTITNATPGTYNLYTLADISIKPSETFTITTDPFTKTFTLSPSKNLHTEGYYTFTYTLNHRINDFLSTTKTYAITDDGADPEQPGAC